MYLRRFLRLWFAICLACLMAFVPIARAQGQRSTENTVTALQYWVDFDPGCSGSFYEDVDDCWAFLYFLSRSPIALAGVSTVFGNTSGELAFRNARRWLLQVQQSHPDVALPDLHRGRSLPVNLSGEMTPAESALQTRLARSPDQSMTLILLGPASNAASILKTQPKLVKKVRRIVMLGGQFRGDAHWIPVNGRLRMRDYNVMKDPLAVQWLLDTGIPIDFIPVTAAFPHLLNAEKLTDSGLRGAAFEWLKKESLSWERFWRWGFGMDGFPAFDLLAAALVLEPEKFTCKRYDAVMGRFPNWVGQAPGLLFVSTPENTNSGALYQRCELTRGKALDLLKSVAKAQ